MIVGIVDYGSGNLKSIENMLTYLDCKYCIAASPYDIRRSDKLIFPGQGHFEQATRSLESSELVDIIKESIKIGKPFLGICLGLQILFDSSEEAPSADGLGLVSGKVVKFKQGKIPQIGWNKIKTTENNSILENEHYYFVNSYYVVPEDKSVTSSVCNYEIDFCASIEKDNLIAVQFHPEKSGEAGIRVFKKWLAL